MKSHIVISLIAFTALAVAFAYFIGAAFDKHKLAPVVSPNKTMNGDLFASVVKRQCDIKGYGTFFARYSGVLDRTDRLLFIMPLLAALIGTLF